MATTLPLTTYLLLVSYAISAQPESCDGNGQTCPMKTGSFVQLTSQKGSFKDPLDADGLPQDDNDSISQYYNHLTREGAEVAAVKAMERIASGRLESDHDFSADNKSHILAHSVECKYDASELVVWWYNGIFKEQQHEDIGYPDCDVKCIVAGSSESCADRADAIVYHLPTYQGVRPHFENTLSIGLSMESSANYPNVKLEALKKSGYDIAATTNLDGDVPVLYFNNFKLYETMAADQDIGFEKRLPAAAFMARNCATPRADIVSKLASLGVNVHSLGSCAPLGTEARHTEEIEHGDKVSFINKYRVYLAFENTVEPGYVSEKIFDGYKAGCINAYRGAPDVDQFVPPESIIRIPDTAEDEEGMKHAAALLKDALENPITWRRRHKWKKSPISDWNGGRWLKRWGTFGKTPPDGFFASNKCRICRAAHAHKHGNKERFNKTTQDLLRKDVQEKTASQSGENRNS